MHFQAVKEKCDDVFVANREAITVKQRYLASSEELHALLDNNETNVRKRTEIVVKGKAITKGGEIVSLF